MIAKLLNKMKQKRKDAAYEDGYNWAAGLMLKSNGSAKDEIEALTNGAFDFTDFDQGARHAMFEAAFLLEKANG